MFALYSQPSELFGSWGFAQEPDSPSP